MYQVYQVLVGETIESIANKLNITADELRRLNGIGDNAIIRQGSYIIIPGNMNNNMNGYDNNMNGFNDNGYKKYIVKQGDNMYAIARDNDVDFKTLLSLNGINENDYIYPNQEIIIPTRKTYVTNNNDTVKEVLDKLNIDIDKLGDLYLMEDQVIFY